MENQPKRLTLTYHTSDGSANSVLFAGGGHPAVGINITNHHLDGGMILGVDDAVARRAEDKTRFDESQLT
jgi:hypothetical protein